MEKKYTFVNGQERTENLNNVELADLIVDVVMSNSAPSFSWNEDMTVLECE